MTNATSTRELRLLFRSLLDKYNIDNLELEILLSESAKQFIKGTNAGHDPVALRREIEEAQKCRVVAEEQDKIILDALESGLHITIRRDTKAAELAKHIRKSGGLVQDFLKWYKSDEFRMKNRAFLNTDKIMQMWPLAFEKAAAAVYVDPMDHLQRAMALHAND